MPRIFPAAVRVVLLCLGTSLAFSQANPAPHAFAVFSRVETTSVPAGMDLTVVCSKSVVPVFTQLQGPDRLVIDLPDTLVGSHPPTVPLESSDVKAMRINQFQRTPPITRIVLDLMGARDFGYEARGTSFVVHLRSTLASAPKPAPPAPKPTPNPNPAVAAAGTPAVGLPAGAGSGAVILAGSRVAPGSAITAGGDTAVLRLERGGEIRICPGTTASVTPSANGHSIMTGMSEGAVELHYHIDSNADTVLTPDFRILLSGPGEFHYAISADPKGNTCVRALQGNTASAVISELMGDGTYQVKPGEQVVFHSGRLSQNDPNVPLECGCPPPRQPQLLAKIPGAQEGMQVVTAPADKATPPPPSDVPPTPPPDVQPNSPVMAEVRGIDPPTSSKPQVVVDAPFVFRGTDPPPSPSIEEVKPAPAPPRPAPAKAKKPQGRTVSAPQPTQPQPVQPAPSIVPATPDPPPTFFGRIRRFFRSIFK